jgi:hypothetical protein
MNASWENVVLGMIKSGTPSGVSRGGSAGHETNQEVALFLKPFR